MIKRIIFDLDGTLLLPNYSDEEYYFQRILKPGDQKKFIPQIAKLLSSYEQEYTFYDEKTLSTFLTEKSGVGITPEMIKGWRNVVSNYNSSVVPGAIEALEYFKGLGCSMVILTNWFSEDQLYRMKKASIDRYFETVYGEGCLKPCRESYILAAGNFEPSECLVIGDSLDNDVYGAYRAGIDAIFYNPKGEGTYNKHLVKSIRDLRKLKEINYED